MVFAGGRERASERGREGGREGGREKGREGGRERGEREMEVRVDSVLIETRYEQYLLETLKASTEGTRFDGGTIHFLC